MSNHHVKRILLCSLYASCIGVFSFMLPPVSIASGSVELDGTVETWIPEQRPGMLESVEKPIKLQKFKLSQEAKDALAKRASKKSTPLNTWSHASKLPSKIDLGMNHTPVLDQGQHGSCATFATTGVLDAALGKGDYISQLCQLALGKELENKSYLPSGWNGSLGEIVLSDITNFGILSKDYEHTEGCGGLKEYPANDGSQTGSNMPLDEFHAHSQNIILNRVLWSPIVFFGDSFMPEYSDDQAVDEIKDALSHHHRVVFGSLLDIDVGMHAGLNAMYKTKSLPDTWMLTPEIENHVKEGRIRVGHEIIIYGYDDNAVVHGINGEEQRGVFLIRNSWGKDAGYKGDFAMTYDYFKLLGVEAYKITSIK